MLKWLLWLVDRYCALRPSRRLLEARDWILAALQRDRFRREQTARDLGISRKTLYSRMVRLGLR